MKSIIITGKDRVEGIPYENVFRYTFPTGSVFFKNHEISIGGVNIYASWYNISAEKRNNIFKYYYPTVATFEYKTVTIPDGTYDVDQLNQFLQFTMIQNKHYLIDGSGNYVYYMEFLWNPTKALVEFIAYPVPSATTYTQPPGAPALPTLSQTPILEILAWNINGFGKLIGFWDTKTGTTTYASALYPPGYQGTYTSQPQTPIVPSPLPPAVPYTSVFNQLGTDNDRLFRVVSLNITCSLLYNNLALPCTLLYSFPVSQTPFGEIVTSSPPTYGFIPIKDGIYNDFDISFLDQDNNPVYVRDKDLNVMLMIRKKTETD